MTANVQWQQQVGERLKVRGVWEPAVQRALRTLGHWMRRREQGMEFNPFNNHVALAVHEHPAAEQFLQSVHHDLKLTTEIELLQEQPQHLGSLDEPEVTWAFEALHGLVSPQAST